MLNWTTVTVHFSLYRRSPMPHPLKALRPGRSPSDWFGAELRHWRLARGLTQAELGRQVWTSASMIAKIETAERDCPDGLAAQLDDVLNTGGVLRRARELLKPQHPAALAPDTSPHPESTLPANPLWIWRGNVTVGHQTTLEALPGTFMGGAIVEAGISRASREGDHVWLSAPETPTSHRSHLIIGLNEAEQQVVAVDTRKVRRGPRALESDRLRIPDAYVLDDLSLGLLWALSSLDTALLFDDALLTAQRQELGNFADLRRSAVGRDMAAGLSETSRLWIGSDFCARYILRQCEHLTSTPTFWTRERTGEEASTWLLFAHKYHYLQALSARYPSGATRSFCVPESVVRATPRTARILVLLAAALMESFAIQVHLSPDPAYSTVEGFVLDPGRQAIIATWLGADGIWHVDATDSIPTVREYTDVTGDTHASSVIGAATPALRLQALADYLDLDWTWLGHRCAQLGAYGFAGLTQPSSRLLSTEGVDRACRFIGSLQAPRQ
ncbi:helix-turn-helix transcriptional regulator [Lipingzhangella sp. LS1_29]|uniref:Helix-turn-helix transcriptional regulator n=1 Tax=Lipingzhangella rawalii TaxID=2055835 RepID=A0ABU2HAX9_9ACTN|nr:helix-turn-helix transcriptional regulator [Lipingzhangella rawalii]MDS1272431.1 helix-turn-helix transcriptional regulator [Lipingzhangella rawalii]